jgi:hypothetical protein
VATWWVHDKLRAKLKQVTICLYAYMPICLYAYIICYCIKPTPFMLQLCIKPTISTVFMSLISLLKQMTWQVDGVKLPNQDGEKPNMYHFYVRYLRAFGELLTDMERNGIKVDTKVCMCCILYVICYYVICYMLLCYMLYVICVRTAD